MSQIFTIESNKVVITNLALTQTEGTVTHTGDLTINGTLTVDNLIVNNPDTTAASTAVGQWIGIQEEEINGKGFNWTWGNGGVNLLYRDGGRLWTDGDFDLDLERSYKIDNIPVLSSTELGRTVTKSNLTEIGSLEYLDVSGDAEIGYFAYFNSGFGRLGICNPEPNGKLSVMENDVEVIVGCPQVGSAVVGTYTNHDLSLITDNTARITIKNNGDVSVNGNVTINGTLTVETIVSDTRIDRFTPIEFKSTRDSAIYGKGLVWTGNGATRQFIMMAGPDRLWSTESLDLAADQSYYINNTPVLSETMLGERVLSSSLTKVGVLETLSVSGNVRMYGTVNAESSLAQFKTVALKDHQGELNITSTGLSSAVSVSVTVSNSEVVYADANEISIGDKTNTRKPVKVYGPLSVGVSNPDPDLDLTVKGNIGFADRKFITGDASPVQGTYSKGDICWNNNPQSDNYVGWICVADGAPGTWLPFGAIARQ